MSFRPRSIIAAMVAAFTSVIPGRRPQPQAPSQEQPHGHGSSQGSRRRRRFRLARPRVLRPNYAASPGSQAVHRERRTAFREGRIELAAALVKAGAPVQPMRHRRPVKP